MKVVFIGCVKFSEHCLKEVLKCSAEVVGVVTMQDDGFNADYVDLSRTATDADIPVHYCDKVNDKSTLEWIKKLSPDIIFCFGWSQLLKQELLSLPSMGILGAHPTLLPKNRGRHPIIWALVLGLKETGLTFFFMNKNVDAGPVLAQEIISITMEDTASSLYGKIEFAASKLINAFMPSLTDKSFKVVDQNPSHSNIWRKRSLEDGMIDWRMSATGIFNLVRALTRPYPGAEFVYKDKLVRVWRAAIIEDEQCINTEPGKVIAVRKGVPTIKCQEGAIRLLECESNVALSVGEYL